jgi:uncharacterized protein YPO0396
LIDALEVILLGDTTGRYFNKAAMDKSARTLRGYLKGELGDTMDGGFKYLRNGRFTSYIALEFHDDVKNEDFTMGIVFDSYEDGSEEHRFFCLDDKIPECEFIADKLPMDYKTLNAFFQDKYPSKYAFFDSNRQYQDHLKRKFGGLKEKYFSLFKKATSFSPITDITTFITEYVCDPQANINLDSLQENILQYKRLEEEVKNIQTRIDRLSEIKKTFSIYADNKDNYQISQYIVERCTLEGLKAQLELYQGQLGKDKARIEEIETELGDFANDLAELDRKKVQLIADRANDDVAKLTAELREEKKKAEDALKEIDDEVQATKNRLLNLCQSYDEAADSLDQNLSKLDLTSLDQDRADDMREVIDSSRKIIQTVTKFRSKLLGDLSSITKDDLLAFKDELASFKGKVSSIAISSARAVFNIQKKIASLREEESSMHQGKKAYNPRLIEIKERLEEALKSKFAKDIKVDIFADLIDIKDLSWSNAIEGYLYNQKFNLFVEPKYYLDAYRILRGLLDEYQYFSTSLVDVERIIERGYTAEIGSLAEEIETDDEGARAYADFLIGRLYKAESLEQARNSGNGITKECDLYRSFTMSKINPKSYRESFIGRNLDERFFEEKHKELEANISNLAIYRSLGDVVTKANSIEAITSNEVDQVVEDIASLSKVEGLKQNIASIDSQLAEHDTVLLESLDKRIADIEDDIASINRSKENELLEKGNLEKEIENIEKEKIKTVIEDIDRSEKNIAVGYEFSLVEDKANPIYQKEKEAGKSDIEIKNEFNIQLSRLQYLVNSIKSQLVKLRRDYCNDYHLSYVIDGEDNKIYDDELDEFTNVKLPSYREKIVDSYYKAVQQFKDDFIFKLRSAIEDVEDQINSLNEALKQSSFGRDLYRFTVKPSQVYRRYYDMLKDDLILDTGEDESAFLDKYRDVMDDLFKQITDVAPEKNSQLMSNIDKFTDYRSYLDFDLIVYNKDTGEEQRLSKMIKKKSGGETQTPFYIAVLASFAQIYHVSEEGEISNTIRLIIFDEAFSKMDRGRIKEAVKLLRKFNLQVILSAPSDKVGDISELVDETLVVLHDKNSSYVRLYAEDKR